MLGDYIGVPPVDGAYWFLFVIINFYLFLSPYSHLERMGLPICSAYDDFLCGIYDDR